MALGGSQGPALPPCPAQPCPGLAASCPFNPLLTERRGYKAGSAWSSPLWRDAPPVDAAAGLIACIRFLAAPAHPGRGLGGPHQAPRPPTCPASKHTALFPALRPLPQPPLQKGTHPLPCAIPRFVLESSSPPLERRHTDWRKLLGGLSVTLACVTYSSIGFQGFSDFRQNSLLGGVYIQKRLLLPHSVKLLLFRDALAPTLVLQATGRCFCARAGALSEANGAVGPQPTVSKCRASKHETKKHTHHWSFPRALFILLRRTSSI